MGVTHIVAVSDDALERNKDKGEELEAAVGKAVASLCMDPQYMLTPSGYEEIGIHSVLDHANGVERAGKAHSTEEAIFVWSGNRLQRLESVKDEKIERVRKLFEETIVRRKE